MNEQLAYYPSTAAAGRSLCILPNSITEALKGKRRTAGGHCWWYEETPPTAKEIEESKSWLQRERITGHENAREYLQLWRVNRARQLGSPTP